MNRLQIKVTLVGIDPPIWRRLEVAADMSLEDLHMLLQIAMGWDNDHLFAFFSRPRGSRSKIFRKWEELDPESGRTIGTALAKRSDELVYEYDFGDSWVHRIKLEKHLRSSEPVSAPRCTAGEGPCPPEDCGGIHGYGYMLEVIADKAHPQYDEMLRWVGDDFDPKRIDLVEINSRIESLWGADA